MAFARAFPYPLALTAGPIHADHESPSPETPGLVRGDRSKAFLGGSGGLRVLKVSMIPNPSIKRILWRSRMCFRMVFGSLATAEPHQQQR